MYIFICSRFADWSADDATSGRESSASKTCVVFGARSRGARWNSHSHSNPSSSANASSSPNSNPSPNSIYLVVCSKDKRPLD